MRSYNLFISHSWSYSENYKKLCNLLDKANYFEYKDYSIPKDDPLIINAKTDASYKKQLREKIKEKMNYASVVIILAGVYASYSDSINMEIEISKELGKPILAIEPFASEKTSVKVKESASKIVAWSTSSVVSAIKELVV
jgi:hypothetical protein